MANLYQTRDIAHALLASYQAAQQTMIATTPNPQYLAGYRAALATVALFFGIAPGLVLPDPSPPDVPRLPGP
jgi:hypothetical protein